MVKLRSPLIQSLGRAFLNGTGSLLCIGGLTSVAQTTQAAPSYNRESEEKIMAQIVMASPSPSPSPGHDCPSGAKSYVYCAR